MAGDISVCGIEGLVHEMVEFMHYAGIVHALKVKCIDCTKQLGQSVTYS